MGASHFLGSGTGDISAESCHRPSQGEEPETGVRMLSQKQGSETSHGLVLCDASLVFAGRAGRGSHARLRLAGERAGVPDRL